MPRTKARTEVAMHRVLTSQGQVTYAGPQMPSDDPTDLPLTTYTVTMNEAAAIDLGHPEVITVTIEPGDRLNG